MFNCDECGYGSSTETVLKRHMTTKHKNNSTKHNSVISAPEKERSISLDNSLQLELPVQERENETSIDSPPKATEHIQPISTFKCHLCSFQGTHSFALEAHLTFVHNEILPNTAYTCHICNDIFTNSESFKNHMTHKLHHFYDGTDVYANCHKPNEVGLYYLESWDAVSMTCKDCVHL
jgi:hypothetical protein